MRGRIEEPPPPGVKLARIGPRSLLVARPNVRQYGHQADETVFALAYARLLGLPLVFQRPARVASEAMFEIESSEVRIDRSPGTQLLVDRWCAVTDRVEGARAWRRRCAQDLSLEAVRQLRSYYERHPNNRLVKWKHGDVREKRRRRKLAGTSASSRPYWRRRLVADPVSVSLTPAAERQGREAAARLGIGPETKLVAVHARERGYKLGAEAQDKGGGRDDSVRNARIETHFPAFDFLVERGFIIARMGDPTMLPVEWPGVIDLATLPDRDPYLELYCLWKSHFLICGESGPQGAAYLTDTPSLTVNATDPVSSFPVRSDGIYLLKTIIDRLTGKKLGLTELLSEDHLTHLRDTTRWIYLENTADQILEAVEEMLELLERGTPETPAQTRYKELLTRSVESMQHIAYVRKWGADDGFMGNGRIARSQAELFAAEEPVPPSVTLTELPPEKSTADRAVALTDASRRDDESALAQANLAADGKRILFVMQHLGFIRNYEPTLRLLAERGHLIHIEHLEDRPGKGETAFAERLLRTCAGVTISRGAEYERGHWPAFARSVRVLLDYIRYFDSRYEHASILRARALNLLPRSPQWLFRRLGDRGVRRTMAALRRIELAIPASRSARALVEELRPDLVLVTPLVDFASRQVDYLKAARSVGIPTGLCVASWDNLTNKGDMRIVPDRVFVWNDAQKEEAVAFHGVPASNVVVTGAQLFDHWFGWSPRRSREEFCRAAGLDPDRPFVVFLGSTQGVAPNEVLFVERWLRSLREAQDANLARLGVLIRPHPASAKRYLSLDLSHLDGVTVWPPLADDRSDYYADPGKNDFFESLYYSAAAVGVNTSALIEAAIVGRTVCTLRMHGLEHAQDGTLHFAHLADQQNGILRVAHDMDGHLRDLAEVVSDRADGADEARTSAFVRHFVRPHGLDKAAAPILAEEIEVAAGLEVERQSMTSVDRVLRALLYPLSVLVAAFSRGPEDRDVPLWVRLARPFVAAWVRLTAIGLTMPPRVWWDLTRRRLLPKLRKRVLHLRVRTLGILRSRDPLRRGPR
jgi:putative glycosyltransferase (TIGR04372 family)